MQTTRNTQIEVYKLTYSDNLTRETVESPHPNCFARRLGAATFHRRGNFVAAAFQFGSLLVFLLDLVFLISLYGACLLSRRGCSVVLDTLVGVSPSLLQGVSVASSHSSLC